MNNKCEIEDKKSGPKLGQNYTFLNFRKKIQAQKFVKVYGNFFYQKTDVLRAEKCRTLV